MSLDYAKMIRSVTVEIVRSGQPRSYADHVSEAYLTFSVPEGYGWASKFGMDQMQKDIVKPYVRLFVGDFVEGNRQWHEPYLKTLEMVERGRWHVVVVEPYLD